MKLTIFKTSILVTLMSIFLSSCWIYSFTGASIPPDAKTVMVSYFPNRATQVEPTLSQNLTEALKDRLISQTNLSLADKNADLQFEGEITGYRTSPSAISGNEQATQNRLTITVKVKYINLLDSEKSYESTFTRYEDFDANLSLESIELELSAKIIEQLVDDIFNKALANW